MSARTEWAIGKNWLVRFPKYISELTFLPILLNETDLASRKLTAALRAQRCVMVLAILIHTSYTITVVIKKDNSCLYCRHLYL